MAPYIDPMAGYADPGWQNLGDDQGRSALDRLLGLNQPEGVSQAGISPLSLLPALIPAAGKLLGGALGKVGVGGVVAGGLAAAAAPLIIQAITRGGDIGTEGPGVFDLGTPGPGVFGSTIPGMRGGEAPVKKWWTGTALFYLTNQGRIAVQKRNGVWKIYRPARHLVVSRNPRIGVLLRADKRLTRLVGGLDRVITRRKRTRVTRRKR